MSTVLVTRYEAFGNTPVNPAGRVARRLDGAVIDGARIVARVVPATFFESIDVAVAAIAEVRPSRRIRWTSRTRSSHAGRSEVCWTTEAPINNSRLPEVLLACLAGALTLAAITAIGWYRAATRPTSSPGLPATSQDGAIPP